MGDPQTGDADGAPSSPDHAVAGKQSGHDAEARLRLKIDLYIVPIAAILYLFCFIDRANIGVFTASSSTLCPCRMFTTD